MKSTNLKIKSRLTKNIHHVLLLDENIKGNTFVDRGDKIKIKQLIKNNNISIFNPERCNESVQSLRTEFSRRTKWSPNVGPRWHDGSGVIKITVECVTKVYTHLYKDPKNKTRGKDKLPRTQLWCDEITNIEIILKTINYPIYKDR